MRKTRTAGSPRGIPVDQLVSVLPKEIRRQEMGRGLTQWWDNGAQVNDESETADHSYRDELIAIHRAAEHDKRTST
jgi:hypothetical protein